MSLSRVPDSVQKILKKDAARKFTQLLRAVGNRQRLSILASLCDGVRTWNYFVYELHMNPKSIRDHLKMLQDTRLIQKSKPHGFEITEFGLNTLLFLVGLVELMFPEEMKKITETEKYEPA